MTFISPLTVDEADRRRKRIAADGERIGFDMAFMDSRPAGTVFLMDSAPSQSMGAANAVRVATGRAPAFADARSPQITTDAALRTTGAAIRDAVRAARFAG
jgi:hypothetical protein